MESEDRLIDLLRAYVREEAPADLWQVVSTDLSGVLRKIIALSAECQRAKIELEQLKRHVRRLDENYTLPTHLRHSILQHVDEAGGDVNMSASIVQPQEIRRLFPRAGPERQAPQEHQGRHEAAVPALVQGVQRAVPQPPGGPAHLSETGMPVGVLEDGEVLTRQG